jgi:hypothetical protein
MNFTKCFPSVTTATYSKPTTLSISNTAKTVVHWLTTEKHLVHYVTYTMLHVIRSSLCFFLFFAHLFLSFSLSVSVDMKSKQKSWTYVGDTHTLNINAIYCNQCAIAHGFKKKTTGCFLQWDWNKNKCVKLTVRLALQYTYNLEFSFLGKKGHKMSIL